MSSSSHYGKHKDGTNQKRDLISRSVVLKSSRRLTCEPEGHFSSLVFLDVDEPEVALKTLHTTQLSNTDPSTIHAR